MYRISARETVRIIVIFFLVASQNPLAPTFGEVTVRVAATVFVVALLVATILWFRGAIKNRRSNGRN